MAVTHERPIRAVKVFTSIKWSGPLIDSTEGSHLIGVELYIGL